MDAGKPMNCVDWEERIALYSGGDLVAPAEVEGHVAVCPECGAFLRELEANGAALAMLRAQPLVVPIRPGARSLRWLPYAAAVVLALGAGALWRPEPVPLPPAVRTAVEAPRFGPMPTPVVRPVKRLQRRVEEHEPVVVKMLTDDPEVIIYWVTD